MPTYAFQFFDGDQALAGEGQLDARDDAEAVDLTRLRLMFGVTRLSAVVSREGGEIARFVHDPVQGWSDTAIDQANGPREA